MATRYFIRSLFTSSKQSLISAVSRSYTTTAVLSNSSSSFLLRLRPLAGVSCLRRLDPSLSTRNFSSETTTTTTTTATPLDDPKPNLSNPDEKIELPGCDFEHWLVILEQPKGDLSRDGIIDSYIKLLATVVGSEEEARMKLYMVSTRHYFAFGALISRELADKLKELPGVHWVLPDSYLDVINKSYGGEPFVNGEAVPYDPKYHEEWVRNKARPNEKNKRNDRLRNDRPRDQMNQNSGGPSGNTGGHQPNMQQQQPSCGQGQVQNQGGHAPNPEPGTVQNQTGNAPKSGPGQVQN